MRFITARELRNNATDVWQTLAQDDQIVVTVNGKPVALLMPVSDTNLEETLRDIRRLKAQSALSYLQQQSLKNGTANITQDEIDKEIRQVRRGRKA